MTATSKPRLVQVENPINAQGPIETLKSQRPKLEQSLKWAEARVKYKEETLQGALNRRDQIKQHLELTDLIIAQHAPKPEIHIKVNNDMPLDIEPARQAFNRRYAPEFTYDGLDEKP